KLTVFIQMELGSRSLKHYLSERNRKWKTRSTDVDNSSECQIFSLQLFSAVEYIHNEGIAHRDIKASNIFLKMDRFGSNNLLLGDFGISCLSKDDDTTD
ncbi:hypothetical protein PENTCL1PPCAC_327, partial [Pristionchus entomophagus]